MFMDKSLNRVIFDLGARLGSLEGYLYGEEGVEKKYLAGWLQNIDNEFSELPVETQREIAGDYEEVIKKVVALLQKAYGDGDADTIRGKELAARLKGGNE